MTGFDVVKDIKAPFLGLYGEKDTSPTPEDARKFGELLKQTNPNSEVVIYPGVGHGFFADYRPSYNAEAALVMLGSAARPSSPRASRPEEAVIELERRDFLKLAAGALTYSLATDAAWAQTNKVQVQWLGQATTRITTPGGKVIVIDPWLTSNPKTPAQFKTLNRSARSTWCWSLTATSTISPTRRRWPGEQVPVSARPG